MFLDYQNQKMSSEGPKKRRAAYRPQDFKCHKCPKLFRSKQAVERHLEREVPCDKKCEVCKYVATSKKDYKAHVKAGHVVTNSSPSLNDMTYENVERKKRTVRETRPDGTVIETEEVVENHTLAGIGVKMLQAQLRDNTLMRAVGVALASTTSEERLRHEAAQLMYDVHDRIPSGQSDQSSEKKVFVLTRNTPDSSAHWLELPGLLGLNRLMQHACDMYSFLIECGVQCMQSSTFKNQYVAQSLIGKEQALVVLLKNDAIVTQFSDVKNLTECPDGRKKEAEELMKVIQLRKLEIIGNIKHMLDDSEDLYYISRDIGRFISLTKPKKTPGHISVLEIQN